MIIVCNIQKVLCAHDMLESLLRMVRYVVNLFILW